MPNKRKDGLETLSAWIDSDLKAELRSLAKEQGRSMSELVLEILEERLAKRKENEK
jgi:predicted HicB family RNase H-like nuclease